MLSFVPNSGAEGTRDRRTNSTVSSLSSQAVCLIETTARGKSSQQATRETGMDDGKKSESQRSDIDDDCVSPKDGLHPEVVQYWGNSWDRRSKLHSESRVSKIDVIPWEHCSHTRYCTRTNS